jgi:signal transduction histidine kinase
MQRGDASIYMLIIAGMLLSFLIGIALIMFYTRYHRRLSEQQDKIRKAELAHQKELLHAVIQSQEDERKRIGQDLHDDAGSVLAKLRILFNQNRPGIDYEKGEANHKKLNALIDKAIDNVRNISHRLSPATLEFFGFTDAISELCDAARDSSGIVILFYNDTGEYDDNIPYPFSLHLFRVFEELITNTLKHANALQITVSLTYQENKLLCDYRDDGNGFDLNTVRSGIGLYNISSRISMINGVYTIASSRGEGMHVFISVPFEPQGVKHNSNGKNKYSYSR